MESKEMETEEASCTSTISESTIEEPDSDDHHHHHHHHRQSSLSLESSPMPPRRQRRRPESTRYHQHHHHHAATRLQKVYKSFRTRRQLADCAVLAEQRWWKVLDFAELKRSSISFFDIHHSESAVSRWSRARTKAAKVGKGLSKDEKARKLALQHWLEAIDPRHRYGHNLQFYYVTWLHCESRQPFFFWLDIGGGREVSIERCPRSKLQQQCIKYLGPVERLAYEVIIKDAKFVHKETEELLDTTKGPKDAKWIFVLSTSKTLYVGQKNKGTFQHSSFLAGGATLSAGRLVVEQGVLKAIWPHSGHYLPTEENFQEFISFLMEHNVDLIDVKKSPTEEEEESNNSSSNDQCRSTVTTDDESSIQGGKKSNNREYRPNLANRIGWKMSKLAIPNREEVVYDIFKPDQQQQQQNPEDPPPSDAEHADDEEEDDDEEGYETAEDSFLTEEDFMVPKITSLDEEEEEELEEEESDEEKRRPAVVVPKENIMVRINSHKGMKTYQLANQLSSKWTTGAGPRIGCMRDYPLEIQFRVLEHAQLSPRGWKRRYPLRPLAFNGGGGGGVVQTPNAASSVSRPILHRRAETAVPDRIPVGLDQIETSAD
ncbi:IQ domain-containing protein IQM6 [Linum grandiflorum]